MSMGRPRCRSFVVRSWVSRVRGRRFCLAAGVTLVVCFATPCVDPSFLAQSLAEHASWPAELGHRYPVPALSARCRCADLWRRAAEDADYTVVNVDTDADRGWDAAADVGENGDANWTAVSSSVDIVGASAADAMAVYSKLSNHPLWSKWLTKVQDLGDGTSEWSMNLLGTLTYSWKARILDTGMPNHVAWESISGTTNKGLATFVNIPGPKPACRVDLKISFPAPRLVKAMFSAGQVASALEGLLSRDLSRFRDVVVANASERAAVPGLLVNATHADRTGSCGLVLWETGRIEATVRGFGSVETTNALLKDLSSGMDRLGPELPFRALLDMRRGLGCTPLVVGAGVRFLRGYGGRIKRIAAVGPWPLVALARLIQSAARQPGWQFFPDVESAEEWLAKPLAVTPAQALNNGDAAKRPNSG